MKKHKKLIYGILSFLIPFLLLIFVFNFHHLLDRKVIIKSDIYAQIFPLFNYLKGIFNGSNSFFYSFYKNLGGTMFGTFFYYLSSPFNLVLKFIKSENIPLFFMWLSIIKMSLCSVSMYLYMTYKNRTTNLLIVLFSVFYGLMGYNLNFFVNIMWIDVVLMAPIVLIGLDKLINGGSPWLYIVSLFLSILFNYYISYMLCIFCLIYFVYNILLSDFDREQIIRVIKRFVIISLFTGLMCSFFLIPCFFESRNYFRSLDLNSILSFNFNFFNIFSKSYIGSANFKDILNYSSFNLYCGVCVLFLVYLFLVNKNISKKKRKYTLFLILFMVLPCLIFPLNYVWHLFSSPNYFNYRYSFLLCFFFLNIAYESYNNLNINRSYFITYFLVYLSISIYFFVTSFTNYYNFLSFENLFITILFLIVYYLILRFKNKEKVLCCVMAIEIFLNILLVFNDTSLFSKKDIIDNDYISIVNKYKSDRMEFTDFLTLNDSILMEYYGINNFLSTNNNSGMRFLKNMSFSKKYTGQLIFLYKYQQYILDSVIGIKYVISSYEIDGYNLIDKVNIGENEFYIYENPNYVGIGYVINDYCNNINSGFTYDQDVFNCIIGSKHNYYRDYDIVKVDDGYSSIIKSASNFYLYYPNIANSGIKFDDEVINSSSDLAYLKNDKKNYDFRFSGDIDVDKLKIFYFDIDKFKTNYSLFNTDKLDYRIEGDKLYGSIDTDGGILMITIPYEDGFIVKVDGKRVQYKMVLDTFIGIDLDNGYHDVTIEYSQPYLREGMCISFVSLFLLVIYVKKRY